MAEEIVVPLHIRRTRSAMDMATVAGILCAFGLIAVAIFIGGSPASFVNTPAILIIIGGALAQAPRQTIGSRVNRSSSVGPPNAMPRCSSIALPSPSAPIT